MSTELTYLLYDLLKLFGSLVILFIIMYYFFIPIVIKPKLKAKKLYQKIIEQYHPLGVMQIFITDAGKGSLKRFPTGREHCYLLLYEKEISVVTIDEPLIRVNIPHNYFKSFRIVKDDYIQFSYVENNRIIEIQLSIYPIDRERESFYKYAIKQFDYYKYLETHISKGDQSPTIIDL